MSGAYTHITIANEARALARKTSLRRTTLAAIGTHLKYVELGAVSPDFPYLCIDLSQNPWADAMHHTNSASFLRAAVAAIHGSSTEQQPRQIAWLLGFASHIMTDMTIHPVIELKVGPFIGNETAHRVCEMHQDAYLFPRLNVGSAALTQHLKTGIATCNGTEDSDDLDPAIARVWFDALVATHPGMAASNAPDPGAWHKGFRKVLSLVSNVSRLFPLARHVGINYGLTYPLPEEVEEQYTQSLATPEGPMDLDPLYERARSNVLEMWKGLDAALVHGRSDELDALEDWNLDTGRSVTTNKLVLWKE